MEQFPSVTHDPPPSAYRDPFSAGEVLGKGFAIFFKNLPAFMLMALVIYAPLLVYALTRDPYVMSTDDVTVYTGVTTFGALLLQNLLTAAVTYGVVEQMAGRHAGIGKSMAVGLRRLLPTLGLFIVIVLCMALGLVALIVGMFVVMCMLYVAVPANVIEQNGIGRALSRSAYLTKGYRWNILGLLFLLGIINGAAGWVVETALVDHIEIGGASYVDPSNWTMYVASNIGVMMASGALAATMAAVAYVLLRNEKDGVGVGELAKVFD